MSFLIIGAAFEPVEEMVGDDGRQTSRSQRVFNSAVDLDLEVDCVPVTVSTEWRLVSSTTSKSKVLASCACTRMASFLHWMCSRDGSPIQGAPLCLLSSELYGAISCKAMTRIQGTIDVPLLGKAVSFVLVTCRLHGSILLVAFVKEIGSLGSAMFLKAGALCLGVFQNLCFRVVPVYFVPKLLTGGVKCLSLECFFYILKSRVVDDLAQDGGSCSLEPIHRRQVREPLLLISRLCEQESSRLGSMLHALNLHLNFYSPLMHLPSGLLGESLALRLANTK